MGELVMRVFTHPACGGCAKAVREAWKISRAHPEVTLRTVKLETPKGLAEAQTESIKTIPTIILSSASAELRRWVGSPPPGALAAALAETIA